MYWGRVYCTKWIYVEVFVFFFWLHFILKQYLLGDMVLVKMILHLLNLKIEIKTNKITKLYIVK